MSDKKKEPETILKIERFSSDGYDGYVIYTTEQIISLEIENTNLCNEEFGTKLHIDKKIEEYIDAIVTKGPRWCTKAKDGSAMIIVDTEVGSIKIEVFNHHNGYYPHTIEASWKDYSDKQEL